MRSCFWIGIVFVLGACSPQQEDPGPAIVAQWDEITLDAASFEEEYLSFASTAAVSDGLEARKEYAITMLERAIVADVGRQWSLDTLREVRLDIRRKRETAMRRAWLEKMAQPKLRIPDENDLLDAFRRSNTRLNLEQIYAQTREEIVRYEQRLRSGEPFESLAIESMRIMGVPDSSYIMGWVGFEMMDEAPETEAMKLKSKGEVSKPVASLRGWHLFRLVEREETFHADGTTFDNARENLAFKVYHRRMEEITVPFTDSLMTSHTLQTYMDRLRQAWIEIAPLVPRSTAYMDLIAMNRSFLELKPQVLNRSTPLALVDGKPFTFGQLMDRLPDLPLDVLQPNLRGALELAIRDSVLAARAELDGMGTLPEVKQAESMAANTALYYATLRASADTVDIDRQTQQWYERWKENRYLESVSSEYTYYLFADSTQAWKVIRDFQRSNDWQSALESGAAHWNAKRNTRTDASKGGLPEHTLPIMTEPGERMLSGPWQRDGMWALIEAHSRSFTYQPFELVQQEVRQAMTERLPEIVHQSLLPPNYRREDVKVNETLLQSLFRY